MSNDLKTRPEPGVMDLLNGIITDIHVLVRQQMALFRIEIKDEIGHAREAGSLVAVGFAIVVMGGVLFCEMLVRLLAWMAPAVPLWGCYGIVGVPIIVLGGILCLAGIQKFGYFNTTIIEKPHEFKEKTDG